MMARFRSRACLPRQGTSGLFGIRSLARGKLNEFEIEVAEGGTGEFEG